MTILVRDDDDILDLHLRYHLALGVDFIIATDHSSRDASRNVLERYRDMGVLEFAVEDDERLLSSRWRTRMARRAAELGADWVINPDADEFLWPVGGCVKTALAAVPAQYGAVALTRPELLPSSSDTGHLTSRMIVRERHATGPPKVAFKPNPEVIVVGGAHRLTCDTCPRGDFAAGRLFHYRDRGFAQFQKRIAGIFDVPRGKRDAPYIAGRARGLGIDAAELERRYLAGDLADVYAARAEHRREEIETGLAAGRLVEDRRLASAMARLEETGDVQPLETTLADSYEIQAELTLRMQRRYAKSMDKVRRAEGKAAKVEAKLAKFEARAAKAEAKVERLEGRIAANREASRSPRDLLLPRVRSPRPEGSPR